MSTATTVPAPYRQPLWGTLDRVSRNCLAAAAVCGVVVVIGVLVAPPVPVREAKLEEMPERIAKLILERPQPAAPKRAAPAVRAPEPAPQVARAEPEPAPRTSPPPVERPRPRPARAETKTETAPKVAPDAGTAGREKARVEVAQNLAQATASLDKAIGDLGKALPAADRKDNGRERPRRQARGSVRGARTSTQLEAVDLVADLSAATGGEGAVGARTIDVAAITQVALAGSGEGFGDGAGGGGGDGTGASAPGGAGGEIRSNASLLAVVRRYAPGIQFCYENVLKQDPGLRGKLVVNLTVAADGTVDDVIVLEDTLDSAAVTTCVLAQMRDWRFEAVPAGVVTFQAPFVFTPPRD